MPHRVVVVAFDGISPFHLSVPTLVFGTQPADQPERGYRVTVCAVTPGRLRTTAGFWLDVPRGVRSLRTADTVVLPSWDSDAEVPAELIRELRRAHARGARIVGLCLGAFVVAAAGLVDGRELTTHWHAADLLARRHPSVRVRSDVLWTDLGDVVSSAGTVAALDCCLHLVRSDLGAGVAAQVAKRLVMAPHRDGSQAQFVQLPIPADDGHDEIGRAVLWAQGRLGEPIDLDRWAAAVNVSRRTFTRRFAERLGESPGRWLLRRRLELARELLECTDLSMELIAERSGLGSSASLRRHFRRDLGVSPRRHREQFAGVAAG